MPRKASSKGSGTTRAASASASGARSDINIENELWQAAVGMHGNIAPADYMHYVLPLLFLRYLSLKYERRREELERLTHDASSEYFVDDLAIVEDILNDGRPYYVNILRFLTPAALN